MSELETILRWLQDQIVPPDDMTFVHSTLLRIEQQLAIPADALPRARALRDRIKSDLGHDLLETSISLPQAFKMIETKHNKGQLSSADWVFTHTQYKLFCKGAILETKDLERILRLAE